MTTDTCPFCGASVYAGVAYPVYACRTVRTRDVAREDVALQSPECARYVRTRISQLKRMAEQAFRVWDRFLSGRKNIRHAQRIDRFRRACLREIDRLRGAQ